MMTTEPTSRLSVTLPSDREIVLTRTFDAPRALVFEAFAKPEHLRHWLKQKDSTLTVCEVDLRPGGSWRMVERAGDGKEYAFRGEMREIVPPERMVRTFEFEGMPGHVSVETLVLEELDGGRRTKVITTSTFDSTEDRDGMLQSGMERGASEAYDQLDAYLRSLAA